MSLKLGTTAPDFEAVLRVLDGLQLTDGYQVATPANWKDGDDLVIVPSITDAKEIAEKFPKGHRELRPFLRMTPQPNK
jgi:alkyl hydroperoxide reductase subunit AhpC